MAISTVVSHRNFGSFIGSGRIRGETRSDHQRCEQRSVAAVQYVKKKIFCSKLYHTRANLSFGYTYQSSFDSIDQGNTELSTSRMIRSHHISKKIKSINNSRIETRGIYQCCLSSSYSDPRGIQSSKLDKLRFIDGQKLSSKHSTVRRTRAEFKSEEQDVTRTELEALVPSEGPSEAALPEAVEPKKSWWKQFPKRWVMVLLCFSAFLLCNMDRVNMSIAILPMSKEYNWNSATVGLIQSSFFWGYLLTQVLRMLRLLEKLKLTQNSELASSRISLSTAYIYDNHDLSL